jgi:type I restriction-modification system DNA methylase subunit
MKRDKPKGNSDGRRYFERRPGFPRLRSGGMFVQSEKFVEAPAANPPFNVSDWSGQLLRGDKRWVFGDPPVGNANYAWIQHFIHHLAYPNGRGGGVAGFVMANGSL